MRRLFAILALVIGVSFLAGCTSTDGPAGNGGSGAAAPPSGGSSSPGGGCGAGGMG